MTGIIQNQVAQFRNFVLSSGKEGEIARANIAKVASLVHVVATVLLGGSALLGGAGLLLATRFFSVGILIGVTGGAGVVLSRDLQAIAENTRDLMQTNRLAQNIYTCSAKVFVNYITKNTSLVEPVAKWALRQAEQLDKAYTKSKK